MKIGVKIHPDNKDYARRIRKYVDFFEVIALEGKSYGFLSKESIPLIFHAEDFKYGGNLGNPANNDVNKMYLKFVFGLLKKFKGRYIILNPGIRYNNKCGIENHKLVLKGFDTSKLLVENQPPLKNRTYPFFVRNYDEARDFIRMHKVEMCLDLDHAYASAFFFNREPVEFCQRLQELNPKHIHISNGRNNSYLDAHLHFAEGDFNMVQMKELIPKDMIVTIDTMNDFEAQVEEIKFLRDTEFSQ